MKVFSLQKAAVCGLVLLLQHALTPLIKCEPSEAAVAESEAHHVKPHFVRVVPTGGPKILCPGIEFKQFAQNTPEALTFTFLNLNDSVPLNWVDVHYKVVDGRKMREFSRIKGIELGRLHADRYHKKEFLNSILKETRMGEYVNKRMKQVRVTTGEGESGATQAFEYMTQRLKPGERVIYNMTYSDSVECDIGPFEYKVPTAYRVRRAVRQARVKRWLTEAGGAPRLPCPGIQYEQSVRKTPYGLLFEFKNFNDTIELHYVDVHYRIQPAEGIATTQHRVRSDTPLGTQVNKRMSEVKNKFKFRGGEETGEEFERRSEASQVYQHLIEHLEPGQILHYNMTYSNAVECDIGEFTYKESGDQFYRPHIRLTRAYRFPREESEEELEEPEEHRMEFGRRLRAGGVRGIKLRAFPMRDLPQMRMRHSESMEVAEAEAEEEAAAEAEADEVSEEDSN